jgi:hypothetical protein
VNFFANTGVNSDIHIDEISHAVMIQRMLGKAKELHDNDIIIYNYLNKPDLICFC